MPAKEYRLYPAADERRADREGRRKRFQLIDTGHFQFLPVEEQNFSTGGEEKHTLFTGILLFKVTDGILFGERKAMICFCSEDHSTSMPHYLPEPNFVILVIEYHSYFFPCDGER